MNDDRYAARAARLLRNARARIAPQRATPPDHAIAALGEAIRASAARRRRRRGLLIGAAGAGLCAAAAAVLLVGRGGGPGPAAVATSRPHPAAPGLTGSRAFVAGRAVGATTFMAGPETVPHAVQAGEAWRPGERLRTGPQAVELSTGDGTNLRVAASSAVELLRADDQRWLRLDAGEVSLHVAKLKAGERFVVVTADAEVEVRGTRFDVQIVPGDRGCGAGTVTRVRVQEGVVQVRGPGEDARLAAGGRWPADCASSPGGRSGPPPRTQGTGPHVHVAARAPAEALPRAQPIASPSAKPSPTADPVDAPASTLATENDLFSSALRADRDGHRREAIELLELLLRRFPRSPLTASASAARARLSSPTAAP